MICYTVWFNICFYKKKLENVALMSVPLPFDTFFGSILFDILKLFPAKRVFKLSAFLLFI